ncbi:MAG: tRNA (adenosine(37)-N6)-threonylcarbamoyltransferase complex ATPase subunit type 1 TsaE [Candidatus Omnitrophota bacterium]
MRTTKIISENAKQTVELGKRLARCLKKGDIICLFGDLGSGKTTFTKGIAQGLCVSKNSVNSPTFVLLNIHKGRLPLFHFDLYRLDNIDEILMIGYEEFFYGEGVSIVEWAEKLKKLLPENHLSVKISLKKNNQRLIQISARGSRYQELLKEFIK